MLHGDLLGERARLTPVKTALVDVATGRRYSYADLDGRASGTARFLHADLGLAKGDRLGLLAGNSVEFLDLFFAVAKAGVILVPLSTRLAAHELEFVVRDSGVRVLIYDHTTIDTVRALRDGVRTAPARSVERWVTIDERAVEGDDVLADRVSLSASIPWSPLRSDPEDPYCLLYTSGTTGQPKGVIVPHRMVTWNGYNTVIGWQLREDDVSPIFTPLYHAGALGAFLIPIFTIGGTIVLHRGFDASEVWRTIEAESNSAAPPIPTANEASTCRRVGS